MNFHLRLSLPSDPRCLPVVRATVDELGALCGLSVEECGGITLAVDEALANVIRHAYGGCYDRVIEFECMIDDRQMVFTLLDQGVPPDLARICAQPLDAISLSGRGTHLIRAVMDEVSYTQVAEGNRLKLVKNLSASKPIIDAD